MPDEFEISVVMYDGLRPPYGIVDRRGEKLVSGGVIERIVF